MAMSFYKFAQVLVMVTMVLPHPVPLPPDSPCPNIFTYEKVKHPGDIIFPGKDQPYWRGVIHIPGHIPVSGGAMNLRVLLSVPAALPTKYVGRIEFKGDREKLLEGSQGSSSVAEYDVIFPSNIPIPHLLEIRINDYILCKGLTTQSAVVTKIFLEHSLFPFRVSITARRGGFTDSEDSTGGFDSTVTCGSFTAENPLVVAGRSSKTRNWPWLVPIFKTSQDGRGVQFQCAGTLVSDRFILSAAHCFTDSSEQDIVVYVGRQNIRNWAGTESQPRSVKSIIVHPDYDRELSLSHSDLVLLELTTPVVWSPTVHPVCLWNGATNLDLIVGKRATVVGWGTDKADQTKVTSEPNSAELPIVSQETCLRSSLEFYFFTSNRTLCAGARDGSGPCYGDSGSGLYLPLQDPGGAMRWYLRGVVSMSLVDKNTSQCDLRSFTVFSDVAQFRPWLQKIVGTTG